MWLDLNVVQFRNFKHIIGLNSRCVIWQTTPRLCRLKF
jgi:hypothetical protein